MSILIKGMEMPKNCAGCFLRVGKCSKRIYMENRPSDCPLNEVPEPHGQLGDLDDIIKRAKKWIDHPDEYIRQRNKDMIYILEREDAVIPASEVE